MKRLQRLLFIRPNMGDFRSRDAMEPLAAALLKTLTPAAVDFAFVDERLDPVDPDAEADLVAMTVETFTARHAYELADGFRRRSIPVVLGGYHPSFCPDEALEHADAAAIGDAEAIWPRLLADFECGRLQRRYRDPGTGPILWFKKPGAMLKSMRTEPKASIQTNIYDGRFGVCYGTSVDTYELSNGHGYKFDSTWTATVIKEGNQWKLLALHVGVNPIENPLIDGYRKGLGFGGVAIEVMRLFE